MKGILALTADRRPQGQAVLRVEGSVDLSTLKQFEGAVQGLDGAAHLVVDLAHMTYISSGGLSVLIKAKSDRARKKGDVVLVRPQTSILNILTILGLVDFFRLASSVEEALHVRD
jgi:anti-anti-sigma factor